MYNSFILHIYFNLKNANFAIASLKCDPVTPNQNQQLLLHRPHRIHLGLCMHGQGQPTASDRTLEGMPAVALDHKLPSTSGAMGNTLSFGDSMVGYSLKIAR